MRCCRARLCRRPWARRRARAGAGRPARRRSFSRRGAAGPRGPLRSAWLARRVQAARGLVRVDLALLQRVQDLECLGLAVRARRARSLGFILLRLRDGHLGRVDVASADRDVAAHGVHHDVRALVAHVRGVGATPELLDRDPGCLQIATGRVEAQREWRRGDQLHVTADGRETERSFAEPDLSEQIAADRAHVPRRPGAGVEGQIPGDAVGVDHAAATDTVDVPGDGLQTQRSANVLDGDVPRHGLQLDRTLDGPHLDLAARRADANLGAAQDLDGVVDRGAALTEQIHPAALEHVRPLPDTDLVAALLHLDLEVLEDTLSALGAVGIDALARAYDDLVAVRAMHAGLARRILDAQDRAAGDLEPLFDDVGQLGRHQVSSRSFTASSAAILPSESSRRISLRRSAWWFSDGTSKPSALITASSRARAVG